MPVIVVGLGRPPYACVRVVERPTYLKSATIIAGVGEITPVSFQHITGPQPTWPIMVPGGLVFPSIQSCDWLH